MSDGTFFKRSTTAFLSRDSASIPLYSMDRIAKGPEADGILSGAGKTKWWTSTINKILRNEKYIGDALLQKTYTTDFLNKTRVKNNGIVPQYYVEGNHEAITRSNHSKGHLLAGTGRTGTQASCQDKRQ